MINIVTIEREFGSGAPTIARALAERLNFTLWDTGITDQIAKRLRCDARQVEQREERLDPTHVRLMKAFMRGSYEDRTGARLETLDAEGLLHLFERVIGEIAAGGRCVIVGRGSTWFLRERTDACHVFLYASREEKMRRITAAGRSQSDAECLINTVDVERAAYVKRYHNMTWPTRELYHMMLNTGIGDEAVAHLILAEIEVLNHASVPHSVAAR